MSFTSLFGKGEEIDVVIFSPLKGQLTYEGKPLNNTRIKLWTAWKDKKGEVDYFETDTNGYFSIPRKTDKIRNTPLSQLVIVQEIYVEYGGDEVLIWTNSKMDPAEYAELAGIPQNLVCELSSELQSIREDDVLIGIRCTWDSIKKLNGH